MQFEDIPGNKYVIVGRSTIHGRGLYAKTDLRKGTEVIEYVGRRMDAAEADRECENENVFVFTLDHGWFLDGSVDWNPARFINHSCEPNCEALIDDDNRVWITTLRKIRKGEELTYNYNFGLDEYEDHPCQCGSSKCIGYIVAEEHFDHVRAKSRTARHRGKPEPATQA